MKISEILEGADVLSTPIFCEFWHGGPVKPGGESAGGSPPIKVGWEVVASHLGTAGGGYNIFKRRVPARPAIAYFAGPKQ